MSESRAKRIRGQRPGKTLRDEFAMAFATGLTAHPDCGDLLHDDVAGIVAKEAYAGADAMLRERANGDEE